LFHAIDDDDFDRTASRLKFSPICSCTAAYPNARATTVPGYGGTRV
jgi:hypothetical protein